MQKSSLENKKIMGYLQDDTKTIPKMCQMGVDVHKSGVGTWRKYRRIRRGR